MVKGPRTPSVRNDLVNSLQGRTPKQQPRHRRTSTMIEELMSGGHTNDAFAVSQVNTWYLMLGIIRASARYIFGTLFIIALSFGLDIALHHTVFKDTPCTLRSNCDLDNDGVAYTDAEGNTVPITPQVTWMGLSLESWRGVGSFMPEVVFAVVGIALSIVSLILQLSATRYSPFVVDLFFRDSVSSFVMNYFVGTAIYCLWINCLLGNNELNFMPRISVIVMMFAMTTSALMIIPFFQYVFAFIQPKTQVDIMVSEALEAALTADTQTSSAMLERQTKVLDSVQRLSEYALSAVHQKDAAIAFHCVSNMGLVVLEVMRYGAQFPQSKELFSTFRETDETLALPAFENVNANSRGEVYANWLLWMVLFELNSLFAEASGLLADACQQITGAVLSIGVQGVANDDTQTLNLVLKFFNTFMRSGVNNGNIKLCCRVLNDYRKLIESIMRSGKMGEEVVTGVQYIVYYAHIAYVKQVYFIAEIVAYDVSMICETAYLQKTDYQDQVVALLLEVDEVPDDKAQLETLRGVRKAQIKLATFYLCKGETEMATRIRQDMADEPVERLVSIKMELESVQSATFWELEDRGYNFEFLAPERKAQLDNFLALPFETESPNLTSHELRMKKKANRSSSRGSGGTAVDTDMASPPWKEAATSDLMTPGSTPSSLLPNGQRKRRGTAGSAGHTPGATPGTVNQLTVSSTPGSVPGSANSGSGEDSLVPDGADTPLIARIPEETLRASIDAGNIDEGDENAE
jgi:hypothetical protein